MQEGIGYYSLVYFDEPDFSCSQVNQRNKTRSAPTRSSRASIIQMVTLRITLEQQVQKRMQFYLQ